MKQAGCPIKARMPRVPQQRRSRERVESILDVASKLVATEGTADFSVPRIAALLQAPRATVYKFFPSAESILYGLAARHAEQLQVAIDNSGFSDVNDLVQVTAVSYEDPVHCAVALSGVVDADDPVVAVVARALADQTPSSNSSTDPVTGRELAATVIRSCFVHGLRSHGYVDFFHRSTATAAARACL